ncbi:MAG: VWA domain-containing protein, partial [Gemmatimonadota bacterium]
SRGRQNARYALFAAGIFFLVWALAGPQFGAHLEMAARRGVDVVVCLDVSRSMLAEDLKPNRLERARNLVGGLLDRLEGDRVGLVVFAGRAFVQCPLTLDYGAVRLLLGTASLASIPSQGTALGDALRVARSCFEEGDRQYKAILLVSDGEEQEPGAWAQAEAAGAEGVRIYAVGVGTPEGELIPERDGAQLDYHKDREGNYVRTRLSEKLLRDVALAANGAYYRSTLSGSELHAIHDAIANMEQKDVGSQRVTRYEERYQIPLGLAILCLAVAALLPEQVRRRAEWRGRFA